MDNVWTELEFVQSNILQADHLALTSNVEAESRYDQAKTNLASHHNQLLFQALHEQTKTWYHLSLITFYHINIALVYKSC